MKKIIEKGTLFASCEGESLKDFIMRFDDIYARLQRFSDIKIRQADCGWEISRKETMFESHDRRTEEEERATYQRLHAKYGPKEPVSQNPYPAAPPLPLPPMKPSEAKQAAQAESKYQDLVNSEYWEQERARIAASVPHQEAVAKVEAAEKARAKGVTGVKAFVVGKCYFCGGALCGGYYCCTPCCDSSSQPDFDEMVELCTEEDILQRRDAFAVAEKARTIRQDGHLEIDRDTAVANNIKDLREMARPGNVKNVPLNKNEDEDENQCEFCGPMPHDGNCPHRFW
jgi:hypothetical protein